MRGLGRFGYASAVAGVLALAVGGSAAFGADVTATASSLTKKQVQRMIASYVRSHPGPRGPAGAPGKNGLNGANGANGAKGDPGPAGAGIPEVTKFSRRVNAGSGMQGLYSAHGLGIEATCASPVTSSTLMIRSLGGGSTYHLFEVDAGGNVLRHSQTSFPNNTTINLTPSTATYPMSGKMEWYGNDGAGLTFNFMVAYNVPGGECLFTGSIL